MTHRRALLERLRTCPARPIVAVAVGVSLLVSGCATYAPRPGPPGTVLARERSPAVVVRLRDGRTIELFDPALRVDTSAAAPSRPDTVVAGLVFDRRLGRRTPVTLPLRDVVAVSARVPDRKMNEALYTGAVIALAVAGAVVLTFVVECTRHRPTCLD